uniref:Beta'' subunit of RNA polymerase n=1 Tax=Pleurastrosarcina brevispinosa TaxID=163096 RepID=A0A097KN72_9CHLO|nr:beta'' subunit of RNA polymerase [Chlorosarcina brevispinosa]
MKLNIKPGWIYFPKKISEGTQTEQSFLLNSFYPVDDLSFDQQFVSLQLILLRNSFFLQNSILWKNELYFENRSKRQPPKKVNEKLNNIFLVSISEKGFIQKNKKSKNKPKTENYRLTEKGQPVLKTNQLIARSAFLRSQFLNRFFSKNIIFLNSANQKLEVTELNFSKKSFFSSKKLRISTSIFLKKDFLYYRFEWNHKNRWRQQEKQIADSQIISSLKLPLAVNSKQNKQILTKQRLIVPNPIFTKSNSSFDYRLQKKLRAKRLTSNKPFFISKNGIGRKEDTAFIQKNSFVYVNDFFPTELNPVFEKSMKNSQQMKWLNQNSVSLEKFRYFISPIFEVKKKLLFYRQNLELHSIRSPLINKQGKIKFFHNYFLLKEYAPFLNQKTTILLDILICSKKNYFLTDFKNQIKIGYLGCYRNNSFNPFYSKEIEKGNSLKIFKNVLENGETSLLKQKKRGISYSFLIEFLNYKELNLLTTKARLKRLAAKPIFEAPYSFSNNKNFKEFKKFDSKNKISNYFEKFKKNNICFFILQNHFVFLFGNVSNKPFYFLNSAKRNKETLLFQKQKNLDLSAYPRSFAGKRFPLNTGEPTFFRFIDFSSFNIMPLRKYFHFCFNKKNLSFDSFIYYSFSYSSIKFCLKPKFFVLIQKMTEYSLLNSEKYKKSIIDLSMKNSSVNSFSLVLRDSVLSGKQSFTASPTWWDNTFTASQSTFISQKQKRETNFSAIYQTGLPFPINLSSLEEIDLFNKQKVTRLLPLFPGIDFKLNSFLFRKNSNKNFISKSKNLVLIFLIFSLPTNYPFKKSKFQLISKKRNKELILLTSSFDKKSKNFIDIFNSLSFVWNSYFDLSLIRQIEINNFKKE